MAVAMLTLFYVGFLGHFGTSAKMSWVRSVLGPKCPYNNLNVRGPTIDMVLWHFQHNKAIACL